MSDTEVRPKRVCSPKYAVNKARRGKKLNRWEIEDLAKDPEQSLIYAKKVLKGRFLEGEPAIAASSFAYEYAKEIVRGRWEEVEKYYECAIRGNQYSSARQAAINYFVHIAGVRNPVIEEHILKHDPHRMVEYAKNCVGGRWPEAEKVALGGSMGLSSDYHTQVYKARWPELEDRILFTKKLNWHENRRDMMAQYIKVVPEPGQEFEEKLGRCSKASLILTYALMGLKGRLPDSLHQKMLMFSFDPKRQSYAKKYIKFLASRERQVVGYLSRLNEEERLEILAKSRTN